MLSGVAQDILIWDSPKHCGPGLFPLGFSGMAQTPVYQPMPSMVGMPAAMPMMPGAGGAAAMPGNSSVCVTAEGKGWKGAVSAACAPQCQLRGSVNTPGWCSALWGMFTCRIVKVCVCCLPQPW